MRDSRKKGDGVARTIYLVILRIFTAVFEIAGLFLFIYTPVYLLQILVRFYHGKFVCVRVCVTYKTRRNFIRTTMRHDCDDCVVQFESNLTCYRLDDISEILHPYTTSIWKLHTNKFYRIFSIYLYTGNYVSEICNQSENVYVCGDLHHAPQTLYPIPSSISCILHPYEQTVFHIFNLLLHNYLLLGCTPISKTCYDCMRNYRIFTANIYLIKSK